MYVETVQVYNACRHGTKASACAHWYAKVRTGDTVLIPTHSYNEHSTLNYLIGLEDV